MGHNIVMMKNTTEEELENYESGWTEGHAIGHATLTEYVAPVETRSGYRVTRKYLIGHLHGWKAGRESALENG